MRSVVIMVAVVASFGALSASAQARSGTGLYAPFPSLPGGPRAQRFAAELGVKAKPAALHRGTTVRGGGLRAGGDAASARAGIDIGGRSWVRVVLGGGVAAALLAGGLAVAAPRRAAPTK